MPATRNTGDRIISFVDRYPQSQANGTKALAKKHINAKADQLLAWNIAA
jgi:hypothetical protein